jgi:DNA polymerase alpha subunit B
MVPNPGTFSVNGVKFGATSVDVLFHLRKEEFVKTVSTTTDTLPAAADDTGVDLIANSCRHLLQQRRWVFSNFFPLQY